MSSEKHEFTYQKNSKVLAYHGYLLYEAKVMNTKLGKNNEELYLIHYQGWNKRWDEWLDVRRILPLNESNIAIMNEAMRNAKKQEKKKEPSNSEQQGGHRETGSTSQKSNKKKRKLDEKNNQIGCQGTPPNKKRKRSSKNGTDNISNDNDNNECSTNGSLQTSSSPSIQTNGLIYNDNSIDSHNTIDNNSSNNDSINENSKLEIDLPTELKKKLITDWENITKHRKLMKLPRVSGQRVMDILNDFKDYAIKKGDPPNIITEIVRGLRDYFDQALEVTLLYRFERPQYKEICSQNQQKTMCQIYGVEHLCRLFVKLPQLLQPNDLDPQTKTVLRKKILAIIEFILDNSDKYFINPADYQQ